MRTHGVGHVGRRAGSGRNKLDVRPSEAEQGDRENRSTATIHAHTRHWLVGESADGLSQVSLERMVSGRISVDGPPICLAGEHHRGVLAGAVHAYPGTTTAARDPLVAR